MKKLQFYIISTILFFYSDVYSNVLGNMQTFAPNPDSLIFQNIHSSQTLEKNYFNIGLFTSFVRNEISVYDDLQTPRFVNYKDKAFTYDFILAWGLSQNLEVTYSLPAYLKQEPDSSQVDQHYISEGANGHRLGLKYSFDENKNGGWAGLFSTDLSTTVDNPYIGNSPDPIYNFELAYDHKNKNTGWGLNLGYRKRSIGTPVSNSYFLPISDQFIASAGYVFGLTQPIRYHIELFSSYGLNKDNHPDQTHISSIEALLGMKFKIAKNWWTHLGLTAEILPEGLAPEFRLYAGINHFFRFGSNDTKDTKEIMPHNTEEPVLDPPIVDNDLRIDPAEATVTIGGSINFVILGGNAPFELSFEKPHFGKILGQERFIAPTKSGKQSIKVTDNIGQIAYLNINVIPTPKPAASITLKNLNFVFNTTELTKDSLKELDKNIQNIAKVKIQKIIVIGHTDDVGSEEYNQELSLGRAEVVKNILLKKFNLSSSQVEAVGMGEAEPLVKNNSPKNKLKNRRVELKLYYK